MRRKLLWFAVLGAALPLFGQGFSLDPADLLKPLSDNWTSYSGDYSGKRYSLLNQVNTNTVKYLSLEWLNTSLRTGCGPNGTGSGTAPEDAAGAGRGGGA